MRWKIKVAYDGTDFHGWQRQPGFRSVQQDLEEAATKLARDGGYVSVHGSGRTDAGVHAHGQIAHFDLEREREITPAQLRNAMNGCLAANDVRVMEAEQVADDFDARRSAVAKEYRYRIWNAEILDPAERRTRAHVMRPMNIDAVREAAALFIGEHDFAAFSANPLREVESTVRIVNSIDVVAEGPAVEFRVNGNGFLYKMVRSISGFLIAVGIEREKPEAVTEIMESRTRTARVESAPPQGLTLWEVFY